MSTNSSLSRLTVGALMLAMLSVAAGVSAQDPDRRSFVPAVLKQVLLDPTTYVPAIVTWEATRLDWQSSQIFFQNGWLEHNPGFTVSGRADDTAVTYAEGNRQILTAALVTLQVSLVNNVSARVIERVLMSRYPTHRKLVRTVGWIERSAMASLITYRLSAGHFRQWQENERLAQQFGHN